VPSTSRRSGDVAAGGLAFHRDADGVAVVLNEVKHGQALEAGEVEGFPELAFAGGAVAGGDDGDIVAGAASVAGSFRPADGLIVLSAGGRRDADDVERAVAPVGGHLAAAGRGVIGSAGGLLEHFVRGDAEREAKGAIAIIKVEGVVAGAESEAGRDLDGLMACSADLKVDAVLAFEDDFAIVKAAGGIHEAEGADELFRIEARISSGRRGLSNRRSSSHRWRIPLHQFNREAEQGECEKVSTRHA